MTWNVGKVLSWAADDFKSRGFEQPRLEAEVLLAWVLKCNRLDLYTGFDRPLIDTELTKYRQAISRRRAGEPAAYIIGNREFWSLEFEVNSNVLIPRPETELLVEAAIERCSEGKVLDLCTGSGCIAVSIASERSEITLDAIDISAEACKVAQRNVSKHAMEDRIKIINGDLFVPIPSEQQYALIVTNPPYVTDHEIATLSDEVKREPMLALAAGDDGLDIIRKILEAAPGYLEDQGWLLMELDPRQVKDARNLGISSFHKEAVILNDLTGRARVLAWQK